MYISSVSVQKNMDKIVWTKPDSCVYAGYCGNWRSPQQASAVWTSQYHHLFWYSVVTQDSTQFPQVIHSKGAICQLQDTRQNFLVSSKLQTTSMEL